MEEHNQRPLLDPKISIEDFRAFYWLKRELVQFCRSNGLPTHGGKQEIQKRIELFLESGVVQFTKQAEKNHPKKASSSSIQLNLDSVIPPDFRCSYEARAFLISHAGPTFRYTVRLQQFLKANPGITFLDLIKEWQRQDEEKKAGLKSDIGPQFEYNQFTRDYFNDPKNKDKTKADCIAAWNKIKSLRGNRKYG